MTPARGAWILTVSMTVKLWDGDAVELRHAFIRLQRYIHYSTFRLSYENMPAASRSQMIDRRLMISPKIAKSIQPMLILAKFGCVFSDGE